MKRSTDDIENILNSLEGIRRAETRPFMHTRVMARLQNEEKGMWAQVGFFIARPAVALACLVAVVSANYFVIKTHQTDEEATTISSVNSASDIMQGSNYILALNSYESNPE